MNMGPEETRQEIKFDVPERSGVEAEVPDSSAVPLGDGPTQAELRHEPGVVSGSIFEKPEK